MIKDQMEKIYSIIPLDQIPWNSEAPPEILTYLVKTEKIKPCKAIELGRDTGNYLLYLSTRGFVCTGIDIAASAIACAKKNGRI